MKIGSLEAGKQADIIMSTFGALIFYAMGLTKQ
jgi:hypothetical protein